MERGFLWGLSSEKEEVFFLLLLSEVGVGGASGVEFEVAQCMKNFLLVFCLQGVVVMLNLVLLVSFKVFINFVTYYKTQVEGTFMCDLLRSKSTREIEFILLFPVTQ